MASTRTLFAAGLALIAVITLSAVVVVQQFALQKVSSQLIIPSGPSPSSTVYATQTMIKTVTTTNQTGQGKIVNCVWLLIGRGPTIVDSDIWWADFAVLGPGTIEIWIGYVSRPITATIYYQVSGSNTDIQDIQWTIPASQGQPFSQSVPYTHSEHLPAPGPDHSVEFTLQGTAGVYCLNLSWVPNV